MKTKIMIIMLSIALFATNSVFGMMEEDNDEEQTSAVQIAPLKREELLEKIQKAENLIKNAPDHIVEELYKQIILEKNVKQNNTEIK